MAFNPDFDSSAEKPSLNSEVCRQSLMAVRDSLEVLNGKWKMPILIALSDGERRFRELAREIPGITDKMLSKELKELEFHQLVHRSVLDTFPPTVIYSRTEHSHSLNEVLGALREWGLKHRRKIVDG